MMNIPKFPPDILATVKKMAAQEIEFFKKAMELDLDDCYENLLDVDFPWDGIIAKCSNQSSPAYDSLLAQDCKRIKGVTAEIAAYGKVFYSDSPDGISQSLNVAISATAIDNKLGDSSSATSGIADTSGKLTTYNINMMSLAEMANADVSTANATSSTQISSTLPTIPSGTIREVVRYVEQTCSLVSEAKAKMAEQKEKVTKFGKLSSLKANMNIPSANFIMAGDISADIPKPAAIKEKLLSLLKLPGAFK